MMQLSSMLGIYLQRSISRGLCYQDHRQHAKCIYGFLEMTMPRGPKGEKRPADVIRPPTKCETISFVWASIAHHVQAL